MGSLKVTMLVPLAGFVVACRPDLPSRASSIEEPRLIAVQTEPAEALPGQAIAMTAWVATPDGTASPSVAWAFCDTPKALAENNVVSSACVDAPTATLSGSAVTATLPPDGCALFGPETPPGGFRPRDADATGGYYQPVRVDFESSVGFGLVRIRCNLANAPLDVVQAYQQQYVLNVNPTIDAVTLLADGVEVDPLSIPSDTDIEVRVRWPSDSKETYVVFDAEAVALVSRDEILRTSFFATAGEFESDITAAAGNGADTTNVWHSPSAPGPAQLWVVLRDERGGSAIVQTPLAIVDR